MFDPTRNDWQSLAIGEIGSHDAIALRVGRIIGMWSLVEHQLGHLLSIILHADARIGSLLFASIKSEAGRLAMLDSIISDRLAPEHQEEFRALRKRAKTVGSYRDDLAHTPWAVSSAGELVLLNSADQLMHEAHYVVTNAEDSPQAISRLFDHMGKMYDSNRCYSTREFDFIEKEIRALSDDLAAFAAKVAQPTWLQRRQMQDLPSAPSN